MEQPPLQPLPPASHHHHHQYRNQPQRTCNHLNMAIPPLPLLSHASDNDQTSGKSPAPDCNLASLCDHIQFEGFSNGSFSDIVVHAMGSIYHLHRLILSRSSYFRNMLHGPWKEATAPVVTLQIDDKNVNQEAIALALAYLYGHYPKLNDSNAFRVLAAASFLDLQDLCAICTDFIVSELWTSNFLTYQVFAENQEYGKHGENVRKACWGYLCQSGSMELREVLPKLSSHTLRGLLTSNELWVPSEETRFVLALDTVLKKGLDEHLRKGGLSVEAGIVNHQLADTKGKSPIDTSDCRSPESNIGHIPHDTYGHPCEDPKYPIIDKPSSLTNPFSDPERNRSPSPYPCFEMPVDFQMSGQGCDGIPVERPSEESLCYQFSNNNWLSESDLQNCSSSNSSCNLIMANEWSGYDMHLSWGGRVIGKRQTKCYVKDFGVGEEEYDTFNTIFEEGALLYCNMSFEALLNVRKQLEELGFPCKAVNDGLWLQMLLSQRVQETAAETCKNCCLLGMGCTCRQAFAFSHGVPSSNYYVQGADQQANVGNLNDADSSLAGGGNSIIRPVRVHIRGSNDGLAGIGRGSNLVPENVWPPTRFVYSRVPIEVGNRSGQQSLLGNDDQVAGPNHNGELAGDGLTVLVGLSEGGRNAAAAAHLGQTSGGVEMAAQSSLVGTPVAGPSGDTTVDTGDLSDNDTEFQWESSENASISLDLKTPLSHFPPFRFGVEFEEVHRLIDGQVKHSPEAFYAGSMWKVSVQAFSDEDPHGRRTLGLFIHRRKAEVTDPLRKVHVYTDSREKVTARYQLICPSKKKMLVLGDLKQPGTLLPKAPKGWGWRSALLFDQLPALLQNGCLRVSALVHLV